MTNKFNWVLGFFIIFSINSVSGQNDSVIIDNDSIINSLLLDYNRRLVAIEQQRVVDSVKKSELLEQLKTTDNIQKENLLNQIRDIDEEEQKRITLKKQRIDSLKMTVPGYPVIGIYKDTLFLVYSKVGASKPKERAINITNRIKKLFDDDFLKTDYISFVDEEYSVDIVYGETIIMSISET
ncbi:MAG: hypothetical protein Q8R90_04080, partial [Bacteroidales bacterium]|nr:hypothetical protein [Bacteroidales bacterium]